MVFFPEMLVLILSLESEISTCSEFLWTLWIVHHFYCIISFSASHFFFLLWTYNCDDVKMKTHIQSLCVSKRTRCLALWVLHDEVLLRVDSSSVQARWKNASKFVWIYKTWLAPYCVCACVAVWPAAEAKTTKRARDDRVSVCVMSWIVWIVKPN